MSAIIHSIIMGILLVLITGKTGGIAVAVLVGGFLFAVMIRRDHFLMLWNHQPDQVTHVYS